jgi:hypothetical protein
MLFQSVDFEVRFINQSFTIVESICFLIYEMGIIVTVIVMIIILFRVRCDDASKIPKILLQSTLLAV